MFCVYLNTLPAPLDLDYTPINIFLLLALFSAKMQICNQ